MDVSIALMCGATSFPRRKIMERMYCDYCNKDLTGRPQTYYVALYDRKADNEIINDDVCALCKPKIERALKLLKRRRG